MNGEKQQITLETLANLTENDKTKHFAGVVVYEKTFNLSSAKFQYFDLGDVQGVSELTLNGKLIGSQWYGAHIYNVKGALKAGENQLSIKLTTVTGNYMKGLTDNKVAQNWVRHQEYYPMGIIGPVRVV